MLSATLGCLNFVYGEMSGIPTAPISNPVSKFLLEKKLFMTATYQNLNIKVRFAVVVEQHFLLSLIESCYCHFFLVKYTDLCVSLYMINSLLNRR